MVVVIVRVVTKGIGWVAIICRRVNPGVGCGLSGMGVALESASAAPVVVVVAEETLVCVGKKRIKDRLYCAAGSSLGC